MIETKFKQTEVGMIPEDWEVKKLGEIAQNFTGLTYSPENIKEYGTLVLRSSNIKSGRLSFVDNVYVDTTIPERAKVKDNDILVCVRNGSKSLIGKCAFIFPNNLEMAFGAFMTILRAKEDAKCLFYIWQSNAIQKQIQDNLGATINQITNADIQRYSTPLPSLSEQKRIATALTSIDNLIASLSALIEKKKLIKQGTMQQLLTAKRRLPGFSEPWVQKKLGEICEFENGYTPSKEVTSFWNNGTINWFRMEDIRKNGRILSNSIQHITSIAVKGDLFPANSIIMSTTATIGEHALLIVDSLANQRFTNLIIRKSLSNLINIYWFFYYCFVLGEWCRNNINEGGLAAVNMDDFSNHEIAIPPTKQEQTAIANVLTSMDNEIASLEAKRAKYETIKQGMMQQLLTGKIRLI